MGIVELSESEDGKSGKLVDVLRTTSTIDHVPVVLTILVQRGVMFMVQLLSRRIELSVVEFWGRDK